MLLKLELSSVVLLSLKLSIRKKKRMVDLNAQEI